MVAWTPDVRPARRRWTGHNAHVKKFPACRYGPFQLRAAIRPGREPEERLIGWGQAHLTLDLTTGLFVTGLMFFPGIGHGLHAAMLSRRTRFVLLTDRRLLLLVASKAIGKMKGADIITMPLGGLRVRPTTSRGFGSGRSSAFSLAVPGLARAIEITLNPNKKSKPLGRLLRGLELLSREADTERP